MDTLFFDLNYLGFRVSYAEWISFDYELIQKFYNRMKQTQDKEKEALKKRK